MAISILKLSDGTITVDFHTMDYRILTGGLSLPPPILKPRLIKSPFIDGDRLASARYENRIIAIRFLLAGDDRDDLLVNTRKIERLLNDAKERILLGYGAQVYLEYQWDTDVGESVYFDVDYGELILPPDFSNPSMWRSFLIPDAVVRLNCKPFGRYANQDIAQETLENEQYGAALNYQDITTSAGQGDIPAKMYWKIVQTGATDPKKVWLAKRSGARQTDNLWVQGEDADSTIDIIGGGHTVTFSNPGNAAQSGSDSQKIALVADNSAAPSVSIPAGFISRFNFDIATIPRGQFRVLAYCKSTYINNVSLALGWV